MTEINKTIPISTSLTSAPINPKIQDIKTVKNTSEVTTNLSPKDNISDLGKGLLQGSVSSAGISIVLEGEVKEPDAQQNNEDFFKNHDVSDKSFKEFEGVLAQFVKDKTIDRDEYNKLKEVLKSAERSPNESKVKVNESIINMLMERLEKGKEKNESDLLINPFFLFASQKNIFETSFFNFTPTYSENDTIEGETPFDIVSNITQSDSLLETKTDGSRCAPSSLLNAYILMGGNFEDLTKKFGIEGGLTYKNVHLLQDMLYTNGKISDKVGFSNGDNETFNYTIDKLDEKLAKLDKEFDELSKKYGKSTAKKETKSSRKPKEKSELEVLAEKINLNVKPLVGFSNKTDSSGFYLTDRKKIVDDFFKANPKGTISIAVHLRKSDKKVNDSDLLGKNHAVLGAPNLADRNHAVLVFKEKNDFYLADTAGATNGNKSSITKMSENEVNALIYTNRDNAFGLTLK